MQGSVSASTGVCSSGGSASVDTSLSEMESPRTLFYRDPNTIFRGNSLTSKCIDETMKLAGMHYLHVTLKPTIEEVCGAPPCGPPGEGASGPPQARCCSAPHCREWQAAVQSVRPPGDPDCRTPCHLLPSLTAGTFRVFQNLPPLFKLKNAYFRKCFFLLKTEDTQRKTGSSENTPFFQMWVLLSQ